MPLPKRDVDATPDDVVQLIRGRELLVEHLGYRPDLHDFEVLSITLERAPWISPLLATFERFSSLRSPQGSR